MSPARHAGRAGFALLPVVLALALLGSIAYLMTRETASGVAQVASTQRTDRARYLAEAALRHAAWQVQGSNCEDFGAVSDTPFGASGDRYSASISPASGSPVTLVATGTLADGSAQTLARTGVAAYETPPPPSLLQPDAATGKDTYLYEWKSSWNFGTSPNLFVSNRFYDSEGVALLEFDVSAIPPEAQILSAVLALHQGDASSTGGTVGARRVTRPWVEGGQSGGVGAASWNERGTGLAWDTPGGDFGANPEATQQLPAGALGWFQWDLTSLVSEWVRGSQPNHGIALFAESPGTEVEFASSDDTNPSIRPALTIVYACECGALCSSAPAACDADYIPNQKSGEFAPSSLGSSFFRGITTLPANALFSGVAAPAEGAYLSVDSEKQLYMTDAAGTLLASCALTTTGTRWSDGVGYLASGARAGQIAVAWNGTASNGVQYLDANCNAISSFSTDGLGAATPSGITHIGSTASGTYDDFLAIAERAEPDAVHIVDLAGVEALELDVSAIVGDLAGVAHLPGSDRLLLADAANSKVVEIDFVNFAGAAIAEYDLAGFGVPAPEGLAIDAASCAHLVGSQTADAVATLERSGARVLYVVKDPDAPSPQELARAGWMDSWGFSVEHIDDDASLADFAAATAANDVAYVSQEALEGSLGAKLANATIGVVNESRDLIDVFGFADSANAGGGLPLLKVEPSHYITSVFETKGVAPYGVNDWYQITSLPVATGSQAVGTWVESPWTDRPALMVAETGADLIAGRTAAGRRVQIPMGAGQGLAPVDIDGLTDDGRTLIQRSIEWAAGAELPPPPPEILLVVASDPPPVPSREDDLRALIEGLGYSVSLIDDSESQASIDAAAAVSDVVYVTGGIGGGTLADKLTGSATPIVNEFAGKLDNFGFSSSTAGSAIGDGFTASSATHEISSPFGGSAITAFSQSLSMPVPSGTLAPGLENVAEVSGSTALAALATGAQRWDGTAAPARRVHLPFGSAEPSQLTSDGETLLQRAIAWAAGGGGGGGGGKEPLPVDIALPGTSVTFAATQDTTLRTNVTTAMGSQPSVRLNHATSDFRALLEFDLSSIAPGTSLSSANLRLYTSSVVQPGTFTVSAYKLHEAWSESWGGSRGANWLDRLKSGPNTFTWATPGGTFDNSWHSDQSFEPVVGSWVEWDLTPLAQEWVDFPANNHGLILLPVNAGPHVYFASSEEADAGLRPRLVVVHP